LPLVGSTILFGLLHLRLLQLVARLLLLSRLLLLLMLLFLATSRLLFLPLFDRYALSLHTFGETCNLLLHLLVLLLPLGLLLLQLLLRLLLPQLQRLLLPTLPALLHPLRPLLLLVQLHLLLMLRPPSNG